MSNFAQQIMNSANEIRTHCDVSIHNAIILGSGLSNSEFKHLDEQCTIVTELNYSDISGLSAPSVPTHLGKIRIYTHSQGNSQHGIAICQGRHHLYEGYSAQQVSALVYLLKQLGAQNLIITNAAGGLNNEYQPGEIMFIEDHINLTGQTPLIGQDDTLGDFFPDMSKAYQPKLLVQAKLFANDLGISYQSGIYAGVLGPSLETSAERRMIRQLGADAIGMSTVTEVIAANHCGLRVLGISAITNKATGDSDQQEDTIESVLHYASNAGKKIAPIAEKLLLSM